MAETPVTCPDLNVVFDVSDTEVEDHDDTWMVYEMFNSAVGA